MSHCSDDLPSESFNESFIEKISILIQGETEGGQKKTGLEYLNWLSERKNDSGMTHTLFYWW